MEASIRQNKICASLKRHSYIKMGMTTSLAAERQLSTTSRLQANLKLKGVDLPSNKREIIGEVCLLIINILGECEDMKSCISLFPGYLLRLLKIFTVSWFGNITQHTGQTTLVKTV